MRASATVNTTASDGTYLTSDFNTTNFGSWHNESFRCYLTATGQSDEQYLIYLPYDEWRDMWDYGSNATMTGRPMYFTVAPDLSIKLGPIPSAAYTIRADYQKKATEMSGDTDTPGMPSQFHQAVVWKGLMYYGGYESAPEAFSRGQGEFKNIIFSLRMNQLPAMLMSGPLA